MSFFNWFSRLIWADPTRDWLAQPPIPLVLDLYSGRFNQIPFGSSYEAAKIFGKPDAIERFSKNFFLFWYLQQGFTLEYDHEKLSYFAFILGPDPFSLDPREINFSSPLIESDRFLPFVVNAQTTKEQIRERFQAPEEEEEDEEETVWYYTWKQIRIEFEFSSKGGLMRLNVYPVE